MAQPIHLRLRTIMLLVLSLWLVLLPLSSTRVVAPLPAAADILAGHVIIPDLKSPLSQNLTAKDQQLDKRALDQASIAKGRRLDCLMSATIEHAQQINRDQRLEADFDKYGILGSEEEGWKQDESKNPKYGSSGIQANLGTLIPGANPGDTIYVFFANVNSWKSKDNPNRNNEPTRAYFSNGFNIQAGLIIADNNLSPRAALGIGDLPPSDSISRILQWSQAAFGTWEIEASALDVPATRISYVIRSWVTNPATQDQIIEALKGLNFDQIPGIANRVVFRRTSTNQAEVDGFYAMLGFPNGAATGFLLASHKEKIGIKRVSEIAIWNHPFTYPFGMERWEYKMNMLFTIELVVNLTENTPEPEPTLR